MSVVERGAARRLFGRVDEQQWLTDAVLRPRSARSIVSPALIEGPAGIGKSTLLRWLVDMVRHQGGGAFMVAATATEFEPPLGLWHRLAADAAARGVHVPRAWLDGDHERTPHQWYAAALELLAAIASSVPVGLPRLVAVDDLHSADIASLQLWLHVLSSHDVDLPVVMAMRHPESHRQPKGRQLLTLLANAADCRLLEPLGTEAVIDLVVSAAGEPSTEWALRWAPSLASLGGGNPLLLHHLVHDLRLADGQRPELDAHVLPESVARPGSRTRDAIERRLATLGASVLEVLHVAALAQHHASVPLLCEVVGRSVDMDLDAASGAGVVSVDDAGFITFTHPLYLEALRRPDGHDAERHHRLALALQRQPVDGGDWTVLLRHLVAAGDLVEPSQRCATASRAADAAHRRGDAEAEAFALELLLREGPAHQFELALRAGDAQFRAGRRERCWELARSVLLTADVGDHEHRVAAALLLAQGSQYAARTFDPERTLLEVAEALPRDHPRRAMVLATAAELAITVPAPDATTDGTPMSWRVRPEEARRTLEMAEAAVVPGTPLDDRARVDMAWCSTHRSPDDVATRRQRSARAANSSRSIDSWVAATHRQAIDALMMADRPTVDACLEQLRAAAQRTGNLTARWHVTVLEATLHLASGRIDDGETSSRHAFALGERADEPGRWAARLGHALAGAFERHGDMTALENAPAPIDWANPLVAAGVVWGRCQTGHLAGPGPSLEQVVERWCSDAGRQDSWLLVGTLAAEGIAATQRIDLAAVVVDQLAPYAHLIAVDANGHYCHGAVARPLAALSGLLGRHDDEARLGALASRLDGECGFERFVIAGRLESLERNGHRNAIVPGAELERILDRTAALGLVRLHGRGLALRGTRPPVSLSARQREILRALAEGLTYQEIASRVGYSHGTVRKEVIAVYALMGVRDRDGAVDRAHLLGLLDRPDDRRRRIAESLASEPLTAEEAQIIRSSSAAVTRNLDAGP